MEHYNNPAGGYWQVKGTTGNHALKENWLQSRGWDCHPAYDGEWVVTWDEGQDGSWVSIEDPAGNGVRLQWIRQIAWAGYKLGSCQECLGTNDFTGKTVLITMNGGVQ